MAPIPNVRQEQILRWLQDTPTLTIDTLVERLGVSVMTVHRDLDALERNGAVTKVHGGVTRIEQRKNSRIRPVQMCDLCDLPVSNRAGVTIQLASGGQLHACCAHCALLLIEDMGEIASVLGKDFIYGRIINMTQATFIASSTINLCCMPNILAFASYEDAARFQVGFGGSVMNFADTHQYVLENHRKVGVAVNG
jgi:hypothetical protein